MTSFRLVGMVCLLALLGSLTACYDDGDDLEIVTDVLPAGRVGEPYTAELEVDGDGDEFRVVSGDLPPGISFSDDGEFFGNPTVAGDFTFTIEVFDLFRGFIDARASKGFSISIAP
ncbi:MAG: putative Ig domain-containing protein [Candidatus Tectomicrobia bacterium]